MIDEPEHTLSHFEWLDLVTEPRDREKLLEARTRPDRAWCGTENRSELFPLPGPLRRWLLGRSLRLHDVCDGLPAGLGEPRDRLRALASRALAAVAIASPIDESD